VAVLRRLVEPMKHHWTANYIIHRESNFVSVITQVAGCTCKETKYIAMCQRRIITTLFRLISSIFLVAGQPFVVWLHHSADRLLDAQFPQTWYIVVSNPSVLGISHSEMPNTDGFETRYIVRLVKGSCRGYYLHFCI